MSQIKTEEWICVSNVIKAPRAIIIKVKYSIQHLEVNSQAIFLDNRRDHSLWYGANRKLNSLPCVIDVNVTMELPNLIKFRLGSTQIIPFLKE